MRLQLGNIPVVIWSMLIGLVLIISLVEIGIIRSVLQPAFERIQQRDYADHMARFEQLLQDEQQLMQFVVDYANWDAMYNFAQGNDASVLDQMHAQYLSDNFSVDATGVFTPDGALQWSIALPGSEELLQSLPESWLKSDGARSAVGSSFF